jgi:hypothetical protein
MVWDYRSKPWSEIDLSGRHVDATVVFKGEGVPVPLLPSPKVCYWPDKLERMPGIEKVLAEYDKVFTPVFPCPLGMTWMPSGYDYQVHRNLGLIRDLGSIYVGTYNSAYKHEIVEELSPDVLRGNNWDASHNVQAIYGSELVQLLNRGKVLIDIHQSPDTGVNRKLFEMIPCGLTLVDEVPGIKEILGDDLAKMVCYNKTNGLEKVRFYSRMYDTDYPQWESIWLREQLAIERYEYTSLAKRLLIKIQELKEFDNEKDRSPLSPLPWSQASS